MDIVGMLEWRESVYAPRGPQHSLRMLNIDSGDH